MTAIARKPHICIKQASTHRRCPGYGILLHHPHFRAHLLFAPSLAPASWEQFFAPHSRQSHSVSPSYVPGSGRAARHPSPRMGSPQGSPGEGAQPGGSTHCRAPPSAAASTRQQGSCHLHQGNQLGQRRASEHCQLPGQSTFGNKSTSSVTNKQKTAFCASASNGGGSPGFTGYL
jgi:hypothetical protein